MIKIYTASADNTIVNTFKDNLSTRATGSNAGQADILEVYSIYGRQTTSSQELSRVLIKFPIDQIVNDRTNSRIPASGSVNFYLNLYNAQTTKSVPRNMKLVVNPLFSDWQEGIGLDLENYSDLTKGNEGSNWMIKANTPGVAEIRKFTFGSDTKTEYGAGSGANYIKLYNGTTRFNVWFNDGSGDTVPSADGTEVLVNISSETTAAGIAEAFKAAVHALSAFTATRDGAEVTVTNVALGPSTHASIEGTISPITIEITQKGTLETPWTSVSGGGDFLSSSTSPDVYADYHYTQLFESGLEDLSIDITALVERWVKGAGGGGIANYGMGVKLTSSQEARGYSQDVHASSDLPTQNIQEGATTSYYTKRFFARGTQYFFKRPSIQAKWDSARRDHRGQFYISSSLAKGENINDIYFYNYVRGKLRSVPGYTPTVSIYSSSGGIPTNTRLRIKDSSNAYADSITSTEVETGVYRARLQVVENLSTLHDVWSVGSTQVHTGTIKPVAMGTMAHPEEPTYFVNITNLQNNYMSNQTARFNVYVREKNWNPTIYTKAVASAPTITIPTASYRVVRTIDNLEAVSHDTGSGVLATGLSHDVSGNYFDFDMRLLQPDYEYSFKIAFYNEELSSWQEQNESFKFRVNKNEY
tara:strand:- start:1888 stop:3816 length:1929 start_codon:yes stop_codon:yes gene_type:complete